MRLLSQAARSLARRPAFSITAIVTLALGIGATTALFSLVDTVLLKPLPFPGADRLVMVLETSSAAHQNASLVAPARMADWNRDNRTFDVISGSYAENVTDTSGTLPERLAGRRVLPRFFAVFDMRPLVGRVFTPDEERFGGPGAAVISEGLWTRRYGRSRSAIGSRLVLNGRGYAIVGVMPAAFTSAAVDVWLPAQLTANLLRMRDARFVTGVGRMRPGVTLAQAQADLVRVQQTLASQYPATDKGWSVSVSDLKGVDVGAYRRPLWLVFGSVLALLLIAVANIGGLLLVQLHRRARELAIRGALGGSRGQVAGAVLREVLIVSAAGAAGGLALALAIVRLLSGTLTMLPRMAELTFDWQAAAFAVAVTFAAALLFGLWPVLHATGGEPMPVLAQGGRGQSGMRHHLQGTLVVGQIALSVLLVASAGLLLRTYYNLSHVKTGFDPSHTITFHVGAQWDENRAVVGQMQERLVSTLEHYPGVTAAGLTNFLPSTGATLRFQVTIQGLTPADRPQGVNVGERTVSVGYLKALRVPLVAGRWCPDLRYDPKAPRTVLVNRRFVDLYGEGQNVVGREIRFTQDPDSALNIVGVVGNLTEDGPGAQPFPYVYACESAGTWPDPDYVVRTAGDAGGLAAAVRGLVHEIAPGRAVFGEQPVARVLAGALDQPRLNARLLTLFALAALLLAALGLYSLLALAVADRTRELGVRMALGATPLGIIRLVVGGAGRLLGIGVGLGLALTMAAGRVLSGVVFGVSSVDVPTLAGTVAVLAAVSVLAVVVPARRAAAIDPIEAMRTDG
ncbi:MAG: ABC transporter permease [Acidobacteriota bacterium]|nr:ABC transporter permease [Acidobacteriota bacterium]